MVEGQVLLSHLAPPEALALVKGSAVPDVRKSQEPSTLLSAAFLTPVWLERRCCPNHENYKSLPGEGKLFSGTLLPLAQMMKYFLQGIISGNRCPERGHSGTI